MGADILHELLVADGLDLHVGPGIDCNEDLGGGSNTEGARSKEQGARSKEQGARSKVQG